MPAPQSAMTMRWRPILSVGLSSQFWAEPSWHHFHYQHSEEQPCLCSWLLQLGFQVTNYQTTLGRM